MAVGYVFFCQGLSQFSVRSTKAILNIADISYFYHDILFILLLWPFSLSVFSNKSNSGYSICTHQVEGSVLDRWRIIGVMARTARGKGNESEQECIERTFSRYSLLYYKIQVVSIFQETDFIKKAVENDLKLWVSNTRRNFRILKYYRHLRNCSTSQMTSLPPSSSWQNARDMRTDLWVK